MVDNIIYLFRNSIENDYLSIFILAIIPLIELRGAIPVAIGMGMQPSFALLLAFCGSSICVVPNMIFLNPILKYLKSKKLFQNLALNYTENIKNKADKIDSKTKNKNPINKYIGICLFVSIPLPLTGAYTGSAVASFLNLKIFPTLLAIMIGNIIAGTILLLLSIFFVNYLDIIIFILAISIVFVILMYYYKNIKQNKLGG